MRFAACQLIFGPDHLFCNNPLNTIIFPNQKPIVSTVLTLNNITKFYGKIHALNNVSFSIPEGCVFGILGPNGSGKTTMLGIVMDILKPTSGSFEFFGQPASAELRKLVGTLLETPNFYHYLSGDQQISSL